MEPTSSKKSIFEVMTHDGHNHIVTPIPLIDSGDPSENHQLEYKYQIS